MKSAAIRNMADITVLKTITEAWGLPTRVRGLHLCLPGGRLMGMLLDLSAADPSLELHSLMSSPETRPDRMAARTTD